MVVRRRRRPASTSCCGSRGSSATSPAASACPCRVGTVRQEEALHRLVAATARSARRPTSSRCSTTSAQVMRDASICGLGQTAASAVRSADRTPRSVRRGRRHERRAPGSAAAPARRSRSTAQPCACPRAPRSSMRAAREGIDTPTLCYADNLTPVNACRVCVVEVEGSRTLVPACSRTAEAGMMVTTDTERVRHSRKLVMEFLASQRGHGSRRAPTCIGGWMRTRRTPSASAPRWRRCRRGSATRREPGHHHEPEDPTVAETRVPAGEDRQRALRARLLASASSATSASRHAAWTRRTRSRSPWPAAGSTRASPPSSPCRSTRVGLRLLRQLHRRVPHRRADVHVRARRCARRAPGTSRSRRVTEHDLPVLRRGLRARAARAGQHDRQGHVPHGPLRHERAPLHQGPVRLPVRAASEAARGPTSLGQTTGARPLASPASCWPAAGRRGSGPTSLAADVRGGRCCTMRSCGWRRWATTWSWCWRPERRVDPAARACRVAHDPTEGEGPLAGLHAGPAGGRSLRRGDRGGR